MVNVHQQTESNSTRVLRKKMKSPAEIFVRGKERTGGIVAKTLQLLQSTIFITFYGQKDKRMFS